MANESGNLETVRARLILQLRDELQHVQSFIELLEHEQQLLLNGEIEALFTLSESKAQSARHLQRCADMRTTVLTQAGLKHTRETLESLLKAQHGRLWQQFMDAAQKAHALNKENGQLITERMQHNQQALAILMSTVEHPVTYGPDGQASAKPGARLFGSV